MKILICEDCTVVFQVYVDSPKYKYYCPSCGDYVSVHKYKAENYSRSKTQIKWKQEELDLIQDCIDGKLQPHQVAIMVGRSINSVKKKVGRTKRVSEVIKSGTSSDYED